MQLGEEDVVADLGDDDRDSVAPSVSSRLTMQVVGERAGRLDPLERGVDGRTPRACRSGSAAGGARPSARAARPPACWPAPRPGLRRAPSEPRADRTTATRHGTASPCSVEAAPDETAVQGSRWWRSVGSDDRRAQLGAEVGELVEQLRRVLACLRVALAQQRQDPLLEQPRLALGRLPPRRAGAGHRCRARGTRPRRGRSRGRRR